MVRGTLLRPLRALVRGFRNRLRGLRELLSPQTRAFARDSFLLELAAGATTLALLAQLALITHSLGLREYGVFALVVSVVSLISRFFDVPVAYTTIAFGAEKVKDDARSLAGIFQFGYVVNLVTGVAGFACVVVLAPIIGPGLIGPDGALLLLLYGVTLVISTVDMTSLSLLRVLDRFDVTLWFTLIREASRILLLVGALLYFHTLLSVVIALVIHDALAGLLAVCLSARCLNRATGVSLFHPALAHVRALRRRMLAMIFHTNIVSYGRLVETQVPAVALGAFWGPAEVAVFKIGQAAGAALAKVTDPVWQALIPRASRLWSAGEVGVLRRVLLQATFIAVPSMAILSTVVILLRRPLLTVVAGHDARSASLVLTLSCVAQFVNGGLFWNIPLLYACKKAAQAAKLYMANLVFLAPLLLILSKIWAANGAAAALLLSTLLLNTAATIVAVRLLNHPEPEQRTESLKAASVPEAVLRVTQ